MTHLTYVIFIVIVRQVTWEIAQATLLPLCNIITEYIFDLILIWFNLICVCMACVYVSWLWAYTCVYVCMNVCICVHVHLCMQVYIQVCVCMHVCRCISMHVCMHLCMHVCMRVCACLCMCMHVCMHVYIRVCVWVCVWMCVYACVYVRNACVYMCVMHVYICVYACVCIVCIILNPYLSINEDLSSIMSLLEKIILNDNKIEIFDSIKVVFNHIYHP